MIVIISFKANQADQLKTINFYFQILTVQPIIKNYQKIYLFFQRLVAGYLYFRWSKMVFLA